MDATTTRQTALSDQLQTATGESLTDYVAHRRDLGVSWDRIAMLIHRDTGEFVSGETLRTWAQQWEVPA